MTRQQGSSGPNRAQRRRKERSDNKYNATKTFTKEQHEKAVDTAYTLGLQMCFQAMKDTLGLGPVRLKRVADRINELERIQFGEDTRIPWKLEMPEPKKGEGKK